MSRKSWKASELAIAKLLGGERVPVNGRIRGSAPDVSHPWLAIEVKSTARMPALALKAMAQAEASSKWERDKFGLKKLPIAILHSDSHPHGKDLVVMRLEEFIEHFGT